MASPKAPPGHFSILYFAAAATFTTKSTEHLPAPVKARDLFARLEQNYPGIEAKVLSSCAVTVNLEYIDIDGDDAPDRDRDIKEGDEVAIIPPQPYYLPTATTLHQHPPPPLAHAPPSALDPALEQTSQQTSPATVGRDAHGAEDDHDDDDDEGDHDLTHMTPGSAKSPGDFKRPRACDSCRGLKVRCDPDPNQPGQSCRRCAKANRPCITTPPTRKRQKKADSRVAELERKIDALTATLHAQKDGGHPPEVPQHHGAIPYSVGTAPEGSFRFGSISHDWSNPPPVPPPQPRYQDAPAGYRPAESMPRGPEPKRRRIGDGNANATIPEDMDAIHRDLAEHPEMRRVNKKSIQADHSYINALVDQLMPFDTAERIFHRYINDICPHFPAVPLAPGTTAQEIREKKPLLFLAILAGSSHGSADLFVSQDVQRELTKLLKDQFADIIWRNGEKSLEIVQALQLGVLWYRPPLHYEQHNFYMMVNCAAVMALDLGLGRRATPNVMKLAAVGPFRRCHPNANTIEARRTFLVCYYLCMSITMVLRRPILLRWTKYMEESVQILESSSEAFPSDKILCQHVKMAHIGESISVQFCMDDPSVEVSIAEPKVIYALKIFENELQLLRDEDARMEHKDPALKLAEHVTNLYVHEIALHHNQSPADFQPPFPSETFTSGVTKKDAIGPAHISALGECLTATHGILDTILSVPLDTLITLPVIFCVRAIYAIVCLMKMWVSVTGPGEVGSIIKKEHLGIESYTDRLVNMFNSIVSRDAQSPHGKFYFVAKRLQERFAQIKEGASRSDSTDTEPRRKPSAPKPRSRQSSNNQTPLHLLSEVAMGSSTTPQQQQQEHPAPQSHSQHQSQQQMPQGWYSNQGVMQQQPQDATGLAFDPNFDFTQFDLNMGSDADLSALFIPDGALWNFAPDPQPGLQAGYGMGF
ncbi:hypothetical protein P154DRAFT_431586 [Amniculicola lignicola CBS 123094]|uniref:Zn(2)-C6 fungal-type domain-containing protein n=1 Tax=Amniculicola lignicola CBS 123094 TaxID=1392246 RepID=A0A6A5WMD7_9PLEO|nr:hypothetical protein P154DRAFT_431586 [Amniculicola lignicola CBS 123094]